MKRRTIFGWKSMIRDTNIRSLFFDWLVPFLISLILCLFISTNDKDVFVELKHLLSICITVIPIIVTLILTAYTILTVFITGKKFASIKNSQTGEALIRALNSSFALCLAVSIITMILTIVASLIGHMEIPYEHAECVNYITYFFVCFLSIFSIYSLFGIVVDVYNCGQTALIDTSSDNTEDKNEQSD